MLEILVTGVFGALRWRIWTAFAYAVFATIVYLSLGYGSELIDNLRRWDPIFTQAFSVTALFVLMKCLGGYGLGWLVGYLGRLIWKRG